MERTIPRQVSLNFIRKVDDRWRHVGQGIGQMEGK